MPERAWKLGDDLVTSDNLLDSITFDELILTVRCNCKYLTPAMVWNELRQILAIRKQDMECLLERNMEAIIEEARKGREA